MAAAVLFLVRCGPASPAEEPAAARKQTRPMENPLFLYSLEVSSGAETVDLLVDKDTTTAWATAPGTGPDEEVVLGMPATFISRLALKAADAGRSAARLNQWMVYADGRAFGPAAAGRPILLEDTVRHLVVRLSEVGPRRLVEREVEGQLFRTGQPPRDEAVQLAELQLYDRFGRPFSLAPPRRLAARVQPTTNLSPLERYHAGCLFDGRAETAWLEGAPGPGYGEKITLTLDDTLFVTDLVVANGWQLTMSHYRDHGRLRRVLIRPLGGVGVEKDLKDQYGRQRIPLFRLDPADAFELEMLDVFPGDRYSDLALSEWVFLEGEQAVSLKPEIDRRMQWERRDRLAGSTLAPWLDRNIYNEIPGEGGESLRRQSITLRSNGRFEIYSHEYSAVYQSSWHTRASGQWTILAADAEETRLQLDGVFYNYSDPDAPAYRGQFFSEELAISKDGMRGKRRVDLYCLPVDDRQ